MNAPEAFPIADKIKEHGTLFKAPMIRAILDGRKNQTRRVVSKLILLGKITEFGKSDTNGYDWHFRDKHMRWHDINHARLLELCPHGKIGEHLWVRETYLQDSNGFIYRADGD